jgi:hypothetical protein
VTKDYRNLLILLISALKNADVGAKVFRERADELIEENDEDGKRS